MVWLGKLLFRLKRFSSKTHKKFELITFSASLTITDCGKLEEISILLKFSLSLAVHLISACKKKVDLGASLEVIKFLWVCKNFKNIL